MNTPYVWNLLLVFYFGIMRKSVVPVTARWRGPCRKSCESVKNKVSFHSFLITQSICSFLHHYCIVYMHKFFRCLFFFLVVLLHHYHHLLLLLSRMVALLFCHTFFYFGLLLRKCTLLWVTLNVEYAIVNNKGQRWHRNVCMEWGEMFQQRSTRKWAVTKHFYYYLILYFFCTDAIRFEDDKGVHRCTFIRSRQQSMAAISTFARQLQHVSKGFGRNCSHSSVSNLYQFECLLLFLLDF